MNLSIQCCVGRRAGVALVIGPMVRKRIGGVRVVLKVSARGRVSGHEDDDTDFSFLTKSIIGPFHESVR